jgi:hypothetical protein
MELAPLIIHLSVNDLHTRFIPVKTKRGRQFKIISLFYYVGPAGHDPATP